MTKLTTVGSKKVVEPEIFNSEIFLSTTKRGNFDQVATGVCPHDNEKLGEEIRGSGIGVTRVCESCGHTWYINKKIRTCKCLTCSGIKRNMVEQRGFSSSLPVNNGGPFWTRTRDLSLIRIDKFQDKAVKKINLSNYLNGWYNEQRLKGITEITLYGYRQKV